jgi:hypothetical protein
MAALANVAIARLSDVPSASIFARRISAVFGVVT